MNPEFSITLPAAVLRTAFGVLSRVISNRATLPVLHCLRIVRVANRITISATDLDVFTTFTHEVESVPLTALQRKLAELRWQREQGSLLVPRSALANVLKAAKHGDVTISTSSVSYLLAGQPVSQPFDTIAADEFPPEWVDFPETTPIVLDVAHRTAVLTARQFASVDETRYVLNGVLFGGDTAGRPAPEVAATDGRRLHMHSAPALASLGRDCIVPNKAIDVLGLPAVSAHDWNLRVNSDTMCMEFSAGPWRLFTKLIDGTYPSYRQYAPDDPEMIEVTISEDAHRRFTEILGSLPKPDNKKPVAVLGFHGQELSIRDVVSGITAVVPGVVSDVPMAIGLDRRFLPDALSAGAGSFRLRDARSPLKFQGGQAINIIMPWMPPEEGWPDVRDDARDSARTEWINAKVAFCPGGPDDEERGVVTDVFRIGRQIIASIRVKEQSIEHPVSNLRLVSKPKPKAARRKAELSAAA